MSSVVGNNRGTVLVADDDEAIRILLADALDGVGCTVIVAERGDAALELARRYRPDAALLDIAMPGLSGYELCPLLRDELGESIAIVLISGMRTEGIDRIAGLLASVMRPPSHPSLLPTSSSFALPLVVHSRGAECAAGDSSLFAQNSRAKLPRRNAPLSLRHISRD